MTSPNSPFDDMPTLAERQYRPPITEARVAAAFEAWLADRNSNGPSRQSGSQGCMGEGDTRYAKRLAAGLFKYLEGV